MKDYIKIAQDLATDKKEKEKIAREKKILKDKAAFGEVKTCIMNLKKGLAQWDGKYGISIKETPAYIEIFKDNHLTIGLRTYWGHWTVDWSDDCRNCPEEGVLIEVLYHKELSGKYNPYSSDKRTSQYYSAETFLESFAEQMAEVI